MTTITSCVYCLVSNIPASFHAADLRNFFAVFVDADKFDMFHFRHRPQKVNATNSNDAEGEGVEGKAAPGVKRFCCIVRFSMEDVAMEFIKKYHHKYWIDKAGNELKRKVFISKVKLTEEDLEKFSSKELRPPPLMPKGNIGTHNQHFLSLIKQCKLPPSLIKKLGLEFPKGRVYKKYSKVPFDYGTKRRWRHREEDHEEEELTDGKGRKLFDTFKGDWKFLTKETEESSDSDEESAADDDDDRCEEWERHEALNDHRTSHGTMFDQDKERLYEEKIELKWEKGGSGLVFYTDAQFWEAQEEDVDDWDVDMEGYYVKGGGDHDAQDFMEMRTSERFQKGLEHISVFNPRQQTRPSRPPSPPAPSSSQESIGAFEKHTRGIGRKILESSGWKDGEGLGSTIIGISTALENDGKVPSDRRGFGYYGEKIEYTTRAQRRKRKNFGDYALSPDAPERIIIGTIYDKPSDLDVSEPLKRRNAPTFLKRYEFVKGRNT